MWGLDLWKKTKGAFRGYLAFMLIQTLISECSQAPASLDEQPWGRGFCESVGFRKHLNLTAAVLFMYVATRM